MDRRNSTRGLLRNMFLKYGSVCTASKMLYFWVSLSKKNRLTPVFFQNSSVQAKVTEYDVIKPKTSNILSKVCFKKILRRIFMTNMKNTIST